MSTARQDTYFASEMSSLTTTTVDGGALEMAIDWIGKNIDPEEVFGEKALLDWARNYDPEGIFDESTLATWAKSNGYTK